MAKILIAENVENRVYHYKNWYKEMDTLIGSHFDATDQYASTLTVDSKIHFDCENPIIPAGVSIPTPSLITLNMLRCKTLVVIDSSRTGNDITVKVGIRSTDSRD